MRLFCLFFMGEFMNPVPKNVDRQIHFFCKKGWVAELVSCNTSKDVVVLATKIALYVEGANASRDGNIVPRYSFSETRKMVLFLLPFAYTDDLKKMVSVVTKKSVESMYDVINTFIGDRLHESVVSCHPKRRYQVIDNLTSENGCNPQFKELVDNLFNRLYGKTAE